MNSNERAALVDERTRAVRQIIAGAMKWAAKNPHKDPDSAAFKDVLNQNAADAYAAATYTDECTCDFCDTDRAPVPAAVDAERVEAAAKGLWDFERDGTNWPAWDEIRAEHYGNGMGWKGQCYYRRMARVALAAAGAAPGLDEMLDSVHPEAAASLQFVQPYLTTDPEPYWQAHVSVPTGGLSGYQKHRGTGPTRMAAIQNAVANAVAAKEGQ